MEGGGIEVGRLDGVEPIVAYAGDGVDPVREVDGVFNADGEDVVLKALGGIGGGILLPVNVFLEVKSGLERIVRQEQGARFHRTAVGIVIVVAGEG